jgi:hypothetical protein
MSISRQQLHSAARRLALDAAAAEAVLAIRAAGARPILLKGASVAQWLYFEQAWERDYGDVDLLVAPDQFAAATSALIELGYHYRSVSDRAQAPTLHASSWGRGGQHPAAIDLHRRLYLMHADDTAVWTSLSENVDVIELGTVAVEVLDVVARTVLLTVHAAWHGAAADKPIRDLQRALEIVDEPTWVEAAALAERLGASEAFACGLRLAEGGDAMASALGLAGNVSAELHLRSRSAHTTSLSLLRLVEAGSWRERTRLLTAELAPESDVIRSRSPLARRGRRGLVAAYVWRTLWMTYNLPRATWSMRAARRAASRRGPQG